MRIHVPVLAVSLLGLVLPRLAFAQSSVREFRLGGAAAMLGRSCVRLTPDLPYQTGTAWFPKPIDLNRPFRMSLSMVLGPKDAEGADGIAFVFHPEMRMGFRGEGMGFSGLYPSIGVEFDTYQNLHLGDPAADHLALVVNGDSAHYGNSPVTLPNLEDGKRHPLELVWDPVTGLVIRLDGQERKRAKADAVRSVFGEASMVYWGMTAATGRLHNPQDVCIETMMLSSR